MIHRSAKTLFFRSAEEPSVKPGGVERNGREGRINEKYQDFEISEWLGRRRDFEEYLIPSVSDISIIFMISNGGIGADFVGGS